MSDLATWRAQESAARTANAMPPIGALGSSWWRKDRILWNRGRKTVDEIVVHDCTVHLEQMTDQSYWIGIYRGDGMREALAVNLSVQGGRMPLLCRVDDASDGEWPWDEDKEHGTGGGV